MTATATATTTATVGGGLYGSTVGALPVRSAIAECVGTAVLVFVGTSTAVASTDAGRNRYDLLAVVLAFGLVLAALVAALGPVSGCHLNPAVTIGLAATRHFPWRGGAIYVAAQVAGGLVGALATWLCFGDRARSGASLGATVPTDGVPQWRALIVEMLVTAVLVLIVISVASDERAVNSTAPIAVGFALAAGIFVAAPLTGGAVNPARAIGPNLITGHIGVLWLYIVGPILGGVLAAVFYDRVLRPAEPPAS